MPRIFIDVTLPISEALPVWPGDQPVEIVRPRDEAAAIERLSLSCHTGTHVDAPAHFFPDGDTVESLPLDLLIGPAWVVHAAGREPITAEQLAATVPAGITRLLIRTENSERRAERLKSAAAPGADKTGVPAANRVTPFEPDFVALTAGAAEWLIARGVRLVGVDAPSVDPFAADDFPAHRTLLAGRAIIIENLALEGVAPGAYELVCLPLPVANADGAPARVVLRREA